MEFELKGALKKYRRMRSWRRAGMLIVVLGALIAPWFFSLGRTDTLICFLGAFTVSVTTELEMRLKTIQLIPITSSRNRGLDIASVTLSTQTPPRLPSTRMTRRAISRTSD